MPRIPTVGKENYHDLENIDIKGNGPKSMKPWILIGLALAAYFVAKSKTL